MATPCACSIPATETLAFDTIGHQQIGPWTWASHNCTPHPGCYTRWNDRCQTLGDVGDVVWSQQSISRAGSDKPIHAVHEGQCFGLVWTILYFRWYAQHAAGRVVRTYARRISARISAGEKTCSSGIPRSGIAKVLRLQTGRKIRTDSDPKGRAHVSEERLSGCIETRMEVSLKEFIDNTAWLPDG